MRTLLIVNLANFLNPAPNPTCSSDLSLQLVRPSQRAVIGTQDPSLQANSAAVQTEREREAVYRGPAEHCRESLVTLHSCLPSTTDSRAAWLVATVTTVPPSLNTTSRILHWLVTPSKLREKCKNKALSSRSQAVSTYWLSFLVTLIFCSNRFEIHGGSGTSSPIFSLDPTISPCFGYFTMFWLFHHASSIPVVVEPTGSLFILLKTAQVNRGEIKQVQVCTGVAQL